MIGVREILWLVLAAASLTAGVLLGGLWIILGAAGTVGGVLLFILEGDNREERSTR